MTTIHDMMKNKSSLLVALGLVFVWGMTTVTKAQVQDEHAGHDHDTSPEKGATGRVVDAAAPRDASVAVDAGRDAAVPAVDAAVAHDAAGAGVDGGTGTPPRRCDCARGAHVPVGWAAWLGLMVVVLRARRRA